MNGPQRARLPDGRWHWQHGPIDLVIGADGDAGAVAQAEAAAWAAFQGLLGGLVAELPLLRQPVAAAPAVNPMQGAVARRMWDACAPLREAADGYLTPMAAVAGSVAQALIAHFRRPGIARAWVNNGGDIALHLAPGAQVRVGLFADLSRLGVDAAGGTAATPLRTDAAFTVRAAEGLFGVATSGWRGRSQSRGIADSVTVLAADAAMADAAATVIANQVDVDHPAVQRRPARALRDDTDLGDILVTVQVPHLPSAQVQAALLRGLACARRLQQQGLIGTALLACQGSLLRLPVIESLESALAA